MQPNKNATVLLGLPGVLYLIETDESCFYVVMPGPGLRPFPFASGSRNFDCPQRDNAYLDALALFGAKGKEMALAPVLDARGASCRQLDVQRLILTISDRLGSIAQKQVAIAIAVEPQIQSNTSLTSEAKKKAARAVLLEEDSSYRHLCEEEAMLARIKAELLLAAEWLEREFRLLRFDYEFALLGHRAGRAHREA